MKATQFFFGFGPRVWSTQRGETEYGVKLFPLGGYVRIIGMNPLEEVEPEDMGRTYREKKFWEKSVVVLAGIGTNFLLAFFLFYGIFVANGIFEVVPVADAVIADSPADSAGLEEGDVFTRIGDTPIEGWDDVTDALRSVGPGPAVIEVLRNGAPVTLDIDLAASELIPGAGYMGVHPRQEHFDVGPFEGIGVAGRFVGMTVSQTMEAIGRMVSPAGLAEYVDVFRGDNEVPDEIRVVSLIGIASISNQLDDVASFLFFMASINVILATLNFFPVVPLDGGHFAIALYEKVTKRQADVRKLIPIAGAVIGFLIFLNVVAVILDITNPVQVP